MALAHAIGDKVEAAYRRGDLFEKRRRMMDEWAAFCAAPSVKAGVACRDVRFQVFQTVTIDPQPSFKYALSNVCSSAIPDCGGLLKWRSVQLAGMSASENFG